VLVAWVWSIIFYVALDPMKWLIAYILDEDNSRKWVDDWVRSKFRPKQQDRCVSHCQMHMQPY
jgi:hypothetical protein